MSIKDTDAILAELDAVGADVTLKRESYSASSRRWSCYISLSKHGATITSVKYGETAAEAIDAAAKIVFDVQRNGMAIALPSPAADRVPA